MKSDESAKFWAVLMVLVVGVAVAITLIDLTIKAAILQESNSLRLKIEDWEVKNGPRASRPNDSGDSDYADLKRFYPAPVLGGEPTGMEAGSPENGAKAPDTTEANGQRKPRSGNRNRSKALPQNGE